MESSSSPKDATTNQVELEAKCQEVFSLQKKNSVLTAALEHLESDNERLQQQLKETKVSNDRRKTIDTSQFSKMYNSQVDELKENLEICEEISAKKDVEIQELKEMIEKLKEQAAKREEIISQTLKGAEDVSFSRQLEQAETEKDEFKDKLADALVDNERLHSKISSMKFQVEELEEEVEGLNCQFNAQCAANERLRTELEELQVMNDVDREKQATDVDRKGNSLFSEVDDRRVKAETVTLELQKRLTDITSRYDMEKAENKRLKSRVLLLRQTVKNGDSEEAVKALQQQLEKAKTEIKELKGKISNSVPVAEEQVRVPENLSNQDKQYVGYLQALLSKTRNDLEVAESRRQEKEHELSGYDFELTRTRGQLREVTKEKEKIAVQNTQLTMELYDMQIKYEPEKFSPIEKEIVKIPLQESTVFNTDFDHQEESSKENFKPLLPKKTVRMRGDVDCITSEGRLTSESLNEDGKGEKLKKTSVNDDPDRKKKFTIVKQIDLPESEEEQTPECNQQ